MSAIQLGAATIPMPVPEPVLRPRNDAPPFPVIASVLRAYAEVVGNRGVVWRLFGAWMAVLALICVAAILPVGLMIENAGMEMLVKPGAAAGPALALSIGVIVICMGVLLATCSIVVGWLRFLLAGERPSMIYLAVGATVWRYLWSTIVLVLLIFLAVLPFAFVMLPLVATSGSANLGQLGNSLMTLLATIAAARLMVAMPVVALGGPRAFREAWSKTTGNTARIAFATILAMLPWQMVVQTWSLVVPAGTAVSMSPVVVACFVVGAVAWSMTILASVGVAATAYRHFFERDAVSGLTASTTRT